MRWSTIFYNYRASDVSCAATLSRGIKDCMKFNSVVRLSLSLAGTIVLLVSSSFAGKLPGDLKVRQEDGTFQNWTVVWVEKPMCIAGDTGAKWAVTSCRKRMLTLWKGMSREQTADMFVHELMHIVTACDDRDQDLHDTIYELAPAVRRVLRDNPKWSSFLLHAPVSEPPLKYGVGPVDLSCAPSPRSSQEAAGGK